MSDPWWQIVNGPHLAQGDLLPGALMPVISSLPDAQVGGLVETTIVSIRLIVLTQSCDLENNKVNYVALCPVSTLVEFEAKNPAYRKNDRWETVRQGRKEGLHLLASPDAPDDNRSCLVVDFGQIVSLPVAYLGQHAASLMDRQRLQSPYLEHFSQAFARFFMRVGLPSSIKPFK